jgi:RHS repeat-associated protein
MIDSLGLLARFFRPLTYSAYGYLGGRARTGRLGYTGQLLDGVVEGYLLGNGHRLYSPFLMRFNSPDALSPFEIGGVNGYAYCRGDPVNRTDPSGRAPSLRKALGIRTKTKLSALLKENQIAENVKPLIKLLKNGGRKEVDVIQVKVQGVTKFKFSFKDDVFSVVSSPLEQLPEGFYLNREDLYIPWLKKAQSDAITFTTGFKRFEIQRQYPGVTLEQRSGHLVQDNAYVELPSQNQALRSDEAPSTNSQRASTSRQ